MSRLSSTGPLPGRSSALMVRTTSLDPTLFGGPRRDATTRRAAMLALGRRLTAEFDGDPDSTPSEDSSPGHPGTPDAGLVTWLRDGHGLVGCGEAARIDVGAGGLDETAGAWDALVANAVIDDEVTVPGTGLVAMGSFAFDPSSARGGSLIVPRVIVGTRVIPDDSGPNGSREVAWLTVVQPLGAPEGTPTVPAGISSTGEPMSPVVDPQAGSGNALRPGPGHASELPATGDWLEVVRNAIDAIRAGEAVKVVTARAVDVRTERPVDAGWLVSRLAAHYPTCWAFAVDGLVGATPELLVRLADDAVTSRVLAGTVPRHDGGDPTDDSKPSRTLVASGKDQEEHEYAVTSVTDALADLCVDVRTSSQPFALVLPNVVHLATDVAGTLRPGALDGSRSSAVLRLASALHPTAAVCGTPTQSAAAVIRRIEGLDRGRYAGPVGWVDAGGNGEWGIALRSAQIDPDDERRLRLFAGCGIVAASQPDVELLESEAKLLPLREALDLPHD